MSRIIFVPICENCGHEFTHLNLGVNFNIKCPHCEQYISSALFPNYNYLTKTDFDSICVQFCYDKKELYGV